MEEMFFSFEEHKLLKKHKLYLESYYGVEINIPDDHNDSYCSSDLILASVSGEKQCIDFVKTFMRNKIEEHKLKRESKVSLLNDVPVITLSESDSSSSTVLAESQNQMRKKRKSRKKGKANCDLFVIEEGESSLGVSNPVEPDPKRRKVVIMPPADEFIPLTITRQVIHEDKAKVDNTPEDCLIILSEEVPVPRPVPPNHKLLRPVVIDGSNVAREHGKVWNTYSCKGIQLSVEHFLKLGHTQVTAFVPLYRRHCVNGPVVTTDQFILEELAKKQQVVFTPSRRIDGKRVTCYDDRFIVELASKNGGVILSNDNYKDLIDDSEEFKKTIKERLLMFCFVGDILMIPSDPLGRHGPKIDEFLSFPVTSTETCNNIQPVI